jgi:O-antigen/teichoic acid export membrane protein
MNRYKGSDFLRSVTLLVGGTAVAQLLMVLLLPVLTRLYSPQDFSTLSVYLGLLSIFSVVATLRFELAIPLPADDEDAANILALGLVCSAVTALLVALALYLCSAELANWLGAPELSRYFWILPIGILLSGAYSSFQFWMGRRQSFRAVAKTKMQQAFFAGAVQLTYGWFSGGALGLILGQTINNGAGAMGLVWQSLRSDARLLSSIRPARMKQMFGAYSRFPKYSTLEALCNNASIQIPVIMIAGLAIGPEAGFLLLAMQIMQAPVSLIGSAVSQVYISKAPEKLREGQLPGFTQDTLKGIAQLGVLPLVIGGVCSPYLFSFIFGESWERTGEMVVYMIPWIAMQLLASPVSMVLHTTNNQPLAMGLQLFGVGVRVGAVAIASVIAPLQLTEIYAATGFLFYFVYLLVVLKVAGVAPSAFFGRNRIILLSVLVIYLAQFMFMLIGPVV